MLGNIIGSLGNVWGLSGDQPILPKVTITHIPIAMSARDLHLDFPATKLRRRLGQDSRMGE
jgi:hypothetical protein